MRPERTWNQSATPSLHAARPQDTTPIRGGRQEDRGPNYVAREAVQRRLVVSCNVAERSLVDTVNDIREQVSRSVTLPRGYRIEYGGQFESEASAIRILLALGIGVLVAIFGLLIVAFRSVLDA